MIPTMNDTTSGCYDTIELPRHWNSSCGGYNDTSYNSSRPSIPPLTYIYITVTVVYALVFVVGIIGNILVLFVLRLNADMKTATNLFLGNLSAADLLLLLVCMPSSLLEFHSKDVWYLGDAMCKLVPYLENVVCHTTMLTLLAISFERYYAICCPLEVLFVCTRRRAVRVLASIWAISLLISVPFLLIPFTEPAEFHDGSSVLVCSVPINTTLKMAFVAGLFVLLFLVPLIILVVLYSKISWRISRNNLLLLGEVRDGKDTAHRRRICGRVHRRQVVCMLILVMVAFFLCLAPLRIFVIWYVFSPLRQKLALGVERYLHIISFSRVMFYINSAVNPIIYQMVSTKFKDAFRRTICREQGTNNVLNNSYISNKTRSSRMVSLPPARKYVEVSRRDQRTDAFNTYDCQTTL